MNESNSGNLSKGDIISFVALLVLGVSVFFGMNFMTLGNKIPSIVVAVLLFFLMIVFVFLAAHAKAQNRNQDKWRIVEYVMLVLYMIALIPCYIYSSKFFDIQFGKQEITKVVQSDIDDINRMFADYTEKCESRCSNFQTELEALFKSDEGKVRIVKLLDLDKQPEQVTMGDIEQATESFRDFHFKARNISRIISEKNQLIENCDKNFKNWNILFIPQYVSELGEAKTKYAEALEQVYTENKSPLENDIPEFDADTYINESNIIGQFTSLSGFSVWGLVAIVVLGGLGLVKYLFGEKPDIIPLASGDETNITDEGGIIF